LDEERQVVPLLWSAAQAAQLRRRPRKRAARRTSRPMPARMPPGTAKTAAVDVYDADLLPHRIHSALGSGAEWARTEVLGRCIG